MKSSAAASPRVIWCSCMRPLSTMCCKWQVWRARRCARSERTVRRCDTGRSWASACNSMRRRCWRSCQESTSSPTFEAATLRPEVTAHRSRRCFTLPRLADRQPRAVVNVGGISNLTGLPKAGDDEPVVGFDIGPGNLLLDHWAHRALCNAVRSRRCDCGVGRRRSTAARRLARRTIFCRAAAKEQRTRALFSRVARARAAEPRPRTRDRARHIDPAQRRCDRTRG